MKLMENFSLYKLFCLLEKKSQTYGIIRDEGLKKFQISLSPLALYVYKVSGGEALTLFGLGGGQNAP